MGSAAPLFAHNTSVHSCSNCSIRSHCLAGELNSKQLEKFESVRSTVRILRKGQQLFRSGEHFNAFYIVRSGTTKVSVTAEDGNEQVTGFYLPGEILGIDGVGNNHYQSTAVALATSSVCVLPFQKLASLGNDLPALQMQLWRKASKEITGKQDMLLSMGRKDSEARIAGFLLSLSLRFKNIGYSGASFNLSMGRQDIGNYLGMTLETVSRILTRFEKAGLIKKERRNIRLLNIPALSDACFDKPLGEIAPAVSTRRREKPVSAPAAFSNRQHPGNYTAAA